MYTELLPLNLRDKITVLYITGLASAGEYCDTGYYYYNYEYCEYGCCDYDSYYDRYDCCSNPTPLIVGATIGAVSFVVAVVIIFIIASKYKNRSNLVVTAAPSTGVATITSEYMPRNGYFH